MVRREHLIDVSARRQLQVSKRPGPTASRWSCTTALRDLGSSFADGLKMQRRAASGSSVTTGPDTGDRPLIPADPYLTPRVMLHRSSITWASIGS